MGKMSVKENKNIYFRLREQHKLTREKASDLLETIPPERIEKIENERSMAHPDEVLIMADKYRAPELCNYYCARECPIGKRYVPEVKVQELSRTVLEMLSSLNSMQKQRDRLIEIASDGKIAKDEIEDFVRIQQDLEKISLTIETLQLWTERMLATGAIDKEIYERILSEYHKDK